MSWKDVKFAYLLVHRAEMNPFQMILKVVVHCWVCLCGLSARCKPVCLQGSVAGAGGRGGGTAPRLLCGMPLPCKVRLTVGSPYTASVECQIELSSTLTLLNYTHRVVLGDILLAGWRKKCETRETVPSGASWSMFRKCLNCMHALGEEERWID